MLCNAGLSANNRAHAQLYTLPSPFHSSTLLGPITASPHPLLTVSPFRNLANSSSALLANIAFTTGLDFAEKKFGQGKVDPAKQRGMNEKITDKARGMFEKATG